MPETARPRNLIAPISRMSRSAPLPELAPPMASFRLASASSRSSLRRSSTSAWTRSAASSGRTLSAIATALSRRSWSARCFRAAAPVSASMRRTPAATALSPVTVIRPISPVRPTWVPPQSSTDHVAVGMPSGAAPIDTTRTSSPYFSPNSAMAPDSIAESRSISRVVTGASCTTTWLASASTLSISLRVERLRMREVETEPVGRDQRALLRHVRAEHAAERGVKEMGGGMVGADLLPARRVDREPHRVADRERARLDLAVVDEEAVRLLLHVVDGEARALVALDRTGIADLAAQLGVERRLVDDDRDLVACARRFDRLAGAADHRQHLGLGGLGAVAEELGRPEPLAELEPDRIGLRLAGPRPARARLLLLPLHGAGEAVGVDRDAARLQRVLGEVEREAEGVVEPEGDVAGERVAAAEARRSPRRGASGRGRACAGSASPRGAASRGSAPRRGPAPDRRGPSRRPASAPAGRAPAPRRRGDGHGAWRAA